jgi:hypothetical protein
LAAQEAAQARYNAQYTMDIDQSSSPIEESPVKLVLLDGIVKGLTHCAYDDCTESLHNAHRGVL